MVLEHSATGGSCHGSSDFECHFESDALKEVLWLTARAPGWRAAELVEPGELCLQKPWPMDAGQELIADLQGA